MASLKKRYDATQKKKAISEMEELIKLLKSDKYEVVDSGIWNGLEGKLNLKVIIKLRDS